MIARITAVLCLVLVLAVAEDPPKKPSLDDFAWLAGSWEGDVGGGKFEEQWLAPVGGVMIGMGRVTSQGQTQFVEFLKIVQEGDEISYRAIIEGQPEVPFALSKLDGGEAVFENPKHDFPQRIIYRLEKDGTLFARVEATKDGVTQGEDFKLKRIR
ncbi:MAG: DUF6265 family protein [Planctomycetota bacterium]